MARKREPENDVRRVLKSHCLLSQQQLTLWETNLEVSITNVKWESYLKLVEILLPGWFTRDYQSVNLVE